MDDMTYNSVLHGISVKAEKATTYNGIVPSTWVKYTVILDLNLALLSPPSLSHFPSLNN